MEFIVPLFIIFVLSFVAAWIALKLTQGWNRGQGAAIISAFLLPGLYVGCLLGLLHLRDDYHRRLSETYNFDGNCVVALGHGYQLGFFDEFPNFSQISRQVSGAAGNYNDNGSPVWLLEDGVRRVGVTGLGVYGGATGKEDPLNETIDHFFWIDFAQGRVERFKTEAELRSKVQGLGEMITPDNLFSEREKRERFGLVTWFIVLFPVVMIAAYFYVLKRWQAVPRERRSIDLAPRTTKLVDFILQGYVHVRST